MDAMFVFGQIVSVAALCCGAVLSAFAAGDTAPGGEDRRHLIE